VRSLVGGEWQPAQTPTFPGSTGVSFAVSLHSSASRVECNVIPHILAATHRPQFTPTPLGKSCQESTCQPTTIYEHFTSFASIFIAYFLGRQVKRVELAALEHFPRFCWCFWVGWESPWKLHFISRWISLKT